MNDTNKLSNSISYFIKWQLEKPSIWESILPPKPISEKDLNTVIYSEEFLIEGFKI